MMAAPAEDRIRNNLDFGHKRMSIYTLPTIPEFKTLEKTLKLPSNTPEEARKFFKSD